MIANPVEMIEKGYIRNLFDPKKQIQPNAIDWSVNRINEFDDIGGPTIGSFYISELGKSMRKQRLLEPQLLNGESVWALQPHTEYDIGSDVYVEVPEGYAALLVLRSTFVRNGCWLASGIFDQGYKGHIGAMLHTGNAAGIIGVGTRIAQIMFIHSNTVGNTVYAGGYNTNDGQHWTEVVTKTQ